MKTYIPYQLCPKCNGDGTVLIQNWNQHETSISGGFREYWNEVQGNVC